MRRILLTVMAIDLAALLYAAPVPAQIVAREEAHTVAVNCITMISPCRGGWGGYSSAAVGEIEELRRGGRLLGYWCHIEPEGHIVVSLLRGLPPVTAYSATWDGDPTCEGDILGIIKYRITTVHGFLEERIGPVEEVSAGDIERFAEFSFRDEWDLLSSNPGGFLQRPELNSILTNYEQHTVMMTTKWDQNHPYNLFCPENSVFTNPL